MPGGDAVLASIACAGATVPSPVIAPRGDENRCQVSSCTPQSSSFANGPWLCSKTTRCRSVRGFRAAGWLKPKRQHASPTQPSSQHFHAAPAEYLLLAGNPHLTTTSFYPCRVAETDPGVHSNFPFRTSGLAIWLTRRRFILML